MDLAEAYVVIRGDRKPFQDAMKQVKLDTNIGVSAVQKKLDSLSQPMRRIGLAITGMGAAITAGFTGLIYQATQAGDTLDKMAKRTGLTVEALSKLTYATQISGGNIQGLERGFRYLSRMMDDISKGIGESKETFEKLGISVTDTAGRFRGVEEVLLEAADKINALGSETEKTAAATDLFGRTGAELLPLLREGSAGIKALTERAEKLGLVMSQETAAAAAEFKDRMTELKASISMLSVNIGSSLMPMLQPLVEQLTQLSGKTSRWAEQHKDLAGSVGTVGLALGGLLGATGPLALLIASAAAMIKPQLLVVSVSP